MNKICARKKNLVTYIKDCQHAAEICYGLVILGWTIYRLDK